MGKRLSFAPEEAANSVRDTGTVNKRISAEWDMYAREVDKMSKQDAYTLYNSGMEHMKNLFNAPGKTLEIPKLSSPADAKAFFQQSVGRGVLNEKYGESVVGFDLGDDGKLIVDKPLENQTQHQSQDTKSSSVPKMDRDASLSKFADIVKADSSPSIDLPSRGMGE